MKLQTLGIALAVSTTMLGGIVYAQCCNWGWDGSYNHSANTADIKKFETDSASLRDQLAVKRQELAQEMNRPDYDPVRAATIKKDIIDLEARLEVLARKNNVYSGCGCYSQHQGGSGQHSPGMMRGGCNCGNW